MLVWGCHSPFYNNVHGSSSSSSGSSCSKGLTMVVHAGTNFLIRSMAFQEANWSPTFTLTEDFALGMYLKMNGWHCRYVEEYLAIGEAPDQVRNCFQQRSRWCKVSPAVISSLHPYLHVKVHKWWTQHQLPAVERWPLSLRCQTFTAMCTGRVLPPS